ncbi:Uncharacterized iron-regulated protein [Halopseudomonas xinjiangensis]|uniref:Uncharacterized iron-regulated protein n=1 Tax=Halopseudomonas xinjiangensis TaxID=487184 RepID=A0A1H1W617_9GAMM|nr:ChaN family lipoprotein [Halopseudomonas xinjiangensis]SDS91916.1 Uncharacterized iron-regulated protein [Halopseudomonas xinjiangensis]
MKRAFYVLALCLAPLLAMAELPPWTAPEQRDHPRLGQILETRAGAWIDPVELVDRLASAPYVVVGEKHDNPDHHALQQWLLEQLHARRPQQSLLLEMLVPAQEAKIGDVRAEPDQMDDQTLQRRLDWDAGWPWALYGELLRWGLREPQRLLPANLGRDEILELYRGEAPPMPEYDEDTRSFLQRTIVDAHCGKLPPEQVSSMLAIQYARDQRMAASLSDAPAPALLIAGSFHARRDLGVALHWPEDKTLAVIMLAEAGGELPSAKQADYVWVTPAMPEEDYCEGW